MAQQAASSIGEAVSLSQALPARVTQALMAAAKTAFIQAHSLVLATAGVLLLLLAAGIWRSLATVAKPQSALWLQRQIHRRARSGASLLF